jgi:endonuclease/exonuclease/phosphatase family metal-dependent hydrolase
MGGNAWSYRSQKVSKLIQQHQPLVFGTQEGLLHMLEDIEKDLAEYSWIGEGRRGGKTDEFCAIFYQETQLEVVESGQFWLSEQPTVPNSISWESDFPRICTWAHFRTRTDSTKEFIVYNTHLDHVSQSARENGVRLIWEKLEKHYDEKKLPIILMGDFNSEPDNVVVQFLRGYDSINGVKANLQDVYGKLKGSPGKTFHFYEGGVEGEPIDYIFTTPDIRIMNTEVDRSEIDESYPSDHYPVITTVVLG